MNRRVVVFCLLNTIFFSFAQTEEKHQINEDEKKYIRIYFDAEKHKLLEEYDRALIRYEECVKLNPQEPSAYNEIAKIYFYSNEWENAEYYIKQAISLDFNNQWYHYLLIDIYVVQNKLLEQLAVYDDLIIIEPNNYLFHLQKTLVLKDLKLYKKAIKFIKKTESKFGASNELLVEMISIYLLQDNFSSAEKVAVKLLKKFPQNKLGYHELAKVYMHYSQYDKAINTYNQLLEINPDEPRAIIATYKIYKNQNDLQNQIKYLKKIATSLTINIETKKNLFYEILISPSPISEIELKPIVERALEMYPNDPLFNLIMGDISAKEKKYNQAIINYNQALKTVFVKDQYIYNKLMEIYFVLGDYQSVINTANEAVEKHPFDAGFYYFKGLAMVNTKEYDGALKALLKGEQYVIDNPVFKSDFFALLGDIYHDLKDDTSSDQAYENALKYNNKNTFVLNNYSYYLSLRGVNLERAKEMTIKCNELTQNEPKASFLDTYAWVLYKLKEYKLAKEQIKKAIDLDKNSATLWEHYGDILYQLGHVDEAVIKWKRAFLLNETNPLLREKITQNE